MKWTTKTDKWRRWFAWLPVCLTDRDCKTCVWLRWYWSRPDGDCTETSFTDPAHPAPAGGDALNLAVRFHETYERLTPIFGYETRTDTRTFDPESKNGKLMIAVCAELLTAKPGAEGAAIAPGCGDGVGS